ncbi:MAG: 2-hydroxyacid dehydrogenase [Lachnospiraceae bacterium]|nr:2-hydroxyacid dehydrogenase [Lachnospiraceae bacterium]
MRILFYDTKTYDKESFTETREKMERKAELQIDYLKTDLAPATAQLAKGYDAVCAFVNSDVSGVTVRRLAENGVKRILMRSAGFNNVDLEEAKSCGIHVYRVPGYSPEAVAEHAMALALGVNRHLHKAYVKVRENDFSLSGLMGIDLHGKTAGIVGTGKIGAAMARICYGFGMKVLAYDLYQNPMLEGMVSYVDFETLLASSDLISLHCPLLDDTYHLIRKETIDQMKEGVIFVNTSRGALVDTEDLIEGIRARKFFGVALDVYEEETPNVFEDRSEDIMEHSVTARLLSFPNVIITSHQGFFTKEALDAIAAVTLDNALADVTEELPSKIC